MERAQDPGDRFAAIARELMDQPTPTSTAERIVELAVEVIQGCDHAGISFVERGRIRTLAAAMMSRNGATSSSMR